MSVVTDEPKWYEAHRFRPFRASDVAIGLRRFEEALPNLTPEEITRWFYGFHKDMLDVYYTQKIYEKRIRELEIRIAGSGV